MKLLNFIYLFIVIYIFLKYIPSSEQAGIFSRELPVRYIPIRKPLKRNKTDSGPYSEDVEAEIAYLTEKLGFISCDFENQSRIKKFVTTFARIRQGHKIKHKIISEELLREASTKHSIKDECRKYLTEPVLFDNDIIFDDTADTSEIQVIDKLLKYTYYFEKEIMITVLQCPVTVRERPTLLYISGLGKVENETSDQYFILANLSSDVNAPLTILMRTIKHKYISQENFNKKDKDLKYINKYQKRTDIRIYVTPSRLDHDYRLFGKDAERTHLTRHFGFVNLSYDPHATDKLIAIVDVLKKGYEVEPTLRVKSKTKNCRWVINTAEFLENFEIDLKEDKKSITAVVKTIHFRLPFIEDENHTFIQCPIILEKSLGPESVETMIYIEPVHYKAPSTCGDFSFILMPLQNNENQTEIFVYSKLIEYEKLLGNNRSNSIKSINSILSTSSSSSP